MNAGRESEHRPLPAGTVTFLLTDVEGSTPRWDRDPDGMAVVIDRHEVILHGTIERHRGVRPVDQGEGDSVVAVFERAADAIAAALDAQLALSAVRWPEGLEVRVRMALHSGDARLRGERNYAGPVLNRGARLRALAAGGQVFVSAATHALVINELPAGVSLVEIGRPQLKGLERPEPVFQLRDDLAEQTTNHACSRRPREAGPRSLRAFLATRRRRSGLRARRPHQPIATCWRRPPDAWPRAWRDCPSRTPANPGVQSQAPRT